MIKDYNQVYNYQVESKLVGSSNFISFSLTNIISKY